MSLALFIDDANVTPLSLLTPISDGWDRTAQTCSLAQLMIDPHYRTLEGYITLVRTCSLPLWLRTNLAH